MKTIISISVVLFAGAVAACSAKSPTLSSTAANATPVPIAIGQTPPPQTTPPAGSSPSDFDINKFEDAYNAAKVAAADYIVAHPNAPDSEVLEVATAAARNAGDSDARNTADGALSDAKGWIAGRKVNGFPPRSTPAELAANDAVADAAARRYFAEMSPQDREKYGSNDTEPETPSRGAHYFPKIGTCFETRVASIASRLENSPDSGDEVSYTDGHSQVSYERSPAVMAFRVGDPIHLCVTDLPGHCPPADDRGIGFVAMDGRTGARWEAGDSEHQCGGA